MEYSSAINRCSILIMLGIAIAVVLIRLIVNHSKYITYFPITLNQVLNACCPVAVAIRTVIKARIEFVSYPQELVTVHRMYIVSSVSTRT